MKITDLFSSSEPIAAPIDILSIGLIGQAAQEDLKLDQRADPLFERLVHAFDLLGRPPGQRID